MRNVYLLAALMLSVQICGAGAEQLNAPHIFIVPDRRGNCFGILELERVQVKPTNWNQFGQWRSGTVYPPQIPRPDGHSTIRFRRSCPRADCSGKWRAADCAGAGIAARISRLADAAVILMIFMVSAIHHCRISIRKITLNGLVRASMRECRLRSFSLRFRVSSPTNLNGSLHGTTRLSRYLVNAKAEAGLRVRQVRGRRLVARIKLRASQVF
jgi:hypothetical protein